MIIFSMDDYTREQLRRLAVKEPLWARPIANPREKEKTEDNHPRPKDKDVPVLITP